MKKKKINKNENEWKGILQETQSNISIENVTTTNGSDYDLDKKWKEFAKDKTLSGEEEHCNVGVNKDWENNMFDKNGMLRTVLMEFEDPNKVNKQKQKRIDFEFTPLTFWQLIPSVAINLHSNEIELTWLCFGMYINWK